MDQGGLGVQCALSRPLLEDSRATLCEFPQARFRSAPALSLGPFASATGVEVGASPRTRGRSSQIVDSQSRSVRPDAFSLRNTNSPALKSAGIAPLGVPPEKRALPCLRLHASSFV